MNTQITCITMKKLCAISLVFLLLLAVGTEGVMTFKKNRCQCPVMSSSTIPVRLVAKFEVLPASLFCDKLEYIVTRRLSRKRLCLDPTSPEVQTMYQNYLDLKNTQPRWGTPRRRQ